MALMLPRSIFFHVQKTDGNWIREAIARAGIPHKEVGPSREFEPNRHVTFRSVETRGKFLFAFVRHPLAWYTSFWIYRMFNGWRIDDVLDPCLSPDFETFLQNVLRRFPKGHLTQRYELYLGPSPGVLDFVGRTERLADDLVRALRLAGEEFNEERLRRTPFQSSSLLRHVISDRLKAALLCSERRVLERFGYSEDPAAFPSN